MHTIGPLHPDSQRRMENTIFYLLLVESEDAKPGIWRADCGLLKKNLYISGPVQLKPVLPKGQLYIFIMASERVMS